jgi:hypothetical protein
MFRASLLAAGNRHDRKGSLKRGGGARMQLVDQNMGIDDSRR